MATSAPQVLSRRTNGVLPVSALQTQNSDTKSRGGGSEASSRKGGKGRARQDKEKPNEVPKKTPKPKKEPEGDKLTVRRLPPGLTEAEFVSILGPEWGMGKGKVDWLSFAPGKVSADPSKPSRPGRAYLHLMQKDLIMALSDTVRDAVWEDAKNSFNNPCLLSPPYVEFSIYKKVPSGRKRADARQGTIDQDAEFMAFLEELANPTPIKEIDVAEEEEASKNEAKITTTPLVQYILEKKARKAKEASAPKSSKHSRNDSTGKGKGAKDDETSTSRRRGKDTKSDKTDKQPKEPMKILSKKTASEQPEVSKPVAAQATSALTDAPKSRRAGIAAAARILQRDLGLSPGSAHRRARQDAAKVEAGAKNSSGNDANAAAQTGVTPEKRAASPTPSEPTSQGAKVQSETTNGSRSQSSRRNRGGRGSDKTKGNDTSAAPVPPLPAVKPVILKKRSNTRLQAETQSTAAAPTESPTTTQTTTNSTGPSKSTSSKSPAASKKAPTVTAGATRGFVKHANPSQGITEAVLKQTLETFGTVTFVEIDKRKGFAYVDFTTHESLVSAVSASPINVAQGTVQVLERKDKKPNPPAASTPSQKPAAADKPAGNSGGGGRGRRGRGGGGGGGGNKPTAAQSTTQNAAAPSTAPPAANSG